MFLSLTTSQAKSRITTTDDFYAYMGQNVKYPEKARLANVQGNSMIFFTVSDGKLSGLLIKTELGEGCDVEVLNTLMAYQHFKTMKNGKYAMITSFRLTGSSAAIKNENIQAPAGYEALKLTIMATAPTSNVAIIKNYGQSTKVIISPINNAFHSSEANPKVYVDSVQIDYDELKYVAPQDIYSMSIYRGVSAVANYGPDAVNGAIVIVTKKSREKQLPKKESPANKEN